MTSINSSTALRPVYNLKELNLTQTQMLIQKCWKDEMLERAKAIGYGGATVVASLASVSVALKVAQWSGVVTALVTLPLIILPWIWGVAILTGMVCSGYVAGKFLAEKLCFPLAEKTIEHWKWADHHFEQRQRLELHQVELHSS